jgi:hypothetical protein
MTQTKTSWPGGQSGPAQENSSSRETSTKTEVTPQARLDVALTYAEQNNWPVFPCRPGEKVPATARGCRDATTDPVRIRAWWSRMPEANIGIATGHPGPDVVDVDCKHGAPGWKSLNRLVRAGLVTGAHSLIRTPSGGLHLYYLGSEQRNSTLAAHGIDFRSTGGYVVAPPSTVNGAPYVLEDARDERRTVDWQTIRTHLQPPRPVRQPQPGGHSNLDALAQWVAGQKEGNRNGALFWAACRAVEGGHTDLGELVAAGIEAGLNELEAHRTVQSAQRRGRGTR